MSCGTQTPVQSSPSSFFSATCSAISSARTSSLRLDLLLQILDALLFGLMVGAAFGLEGGGPVLEEFLLPAVEDRWLQPQLVTQLRDRLLLQQMPPQDGDLLFSRCNASVAFFMRSLRYLNGRTLSPFPAEAEHEPFHLFRYLDEQVYRFNNRKGMDDYDRFKMAASQMIGKRLTWNEVTGKNHEPETCLAN